MTFEGMWAELAPIGRAAASGGYNRQPWASAESELRAWFASAASARRLELETDAMGNQVAWWRPDPVVRDELTPKGARIAWMPPRRSWLGSRMPKFVHGFTVGTFVKDINRFTGRVEAVWRPAYRSEDIFQILTVKSRPKVHGEGRIISRERFRERLLGADVSV